MTPELDDTAVEAAANELLAHGEFSSIPWENKPNALIAAHEAIRAYLSVATPPLPDDVAGVVERLVKFVDFVKNAPVSSGTCCCGDDMENHAGPMFCGHTPIDQWHYSLSQHLKGIEPVTSTLASVAAQRDAAVAEATAMREEIAALKERLREAEYNVKSRLRLAFRKALSELPEIAPPEIRSALSSVHMQKEFWEEGKRLQNLHGLDAVAPRVEQECGAGAWSFMRQGVVAARRFQEEAK